MPKANSPITRRSSLTWAVVLALVGGCGHDGGRGTSRALTQEQQTRYALTGSERAIAELQAQPGAPISTRGRFVTPGSFFVKGACDGADSMVQVTSLVDGREKGASYPFDCGAGSAPVPIEAGKDTEVHVTVFDNRAGHWSVLFYVTR
jgi:hypothetical protein